MERRSRRVGVRVASERELAGRVLGWMFVLSTIVAIVLPMLPGVDGDVITPTLPMGIAALIFGPAALRRTRWGTVAGAAIPAPVLAGAIRVAIATSDNGGGNSPARFLLMLVL